MGTYKVNPDGKAPKGLKIGDVVDTHGGLYTIRSVNTDGTYKADRTPRMTAFADPGMLQAMQNKATDEFNKQVSQSNNYMTPMVNKPAMSTS